MEKDSKQEEEKKSFVDNNQYIKYNTNYLFYDREDLIDNNEDLICPSCPARQSPECTSQIPAGPRPPASVTAPAGSTSADSINCPCAYHPVSF